MYQKSLDAQCTSIFGMTEMFKQLKILSTKLSMCFKSTTFTVSKNSYSNGKKTEDETFSTVEHVWLVQSCSKICIRSEVKVSSKKHWDLVSVLTFSPTSAPTAAMNETKRPRETKRATKSTEKIPTNLLGLHKLVDITEGVCVSSQADVWQ